jgi:hypothetical protein
MKRIARWVLALAAVGLISMDAAAQRNKTKPDASQEAEVSQTVGAMGKVTINYHRPGVHGRNVWTDKSDNPRIGALVPRDGEPWPWRAGANEATTFTISEDMLIEGKELAAGTYGLFMIPTDTHWTIIFNKTAKQWGSFAYKKEDDVLRVDVQSVEAPHEEWLMYGFDDPDAYSTMAYLHWEKVKVPFKIETKNKG